MNLLQKVIDFYSMWPAFLCVGVVMLFAWSPLCRLADSPPSARPRRIVTLDGLRGFLALAVVLHHVAIYHSFLQHSVLSSDVWRVPPSRFYLAIGMVAMSMFFMITGYLFWSRLIEEQGRLRWGRLYLGRIFRIGPLYLAALAMASACDYLSSTPVPPTSLLKQASTWSLLGLSVYEDRHVFLAGVTWSIQDEWLFCLSLPVLAFLFARSKHHLLFSALLFAVPVVLVSANVFHAANPPLQMHLLRASLFFAGMVCASLHKAGIRPAIADGTASCLVVTAVASALIFEEKYLPGSVVLVGAAFFLVASGCGLWGLLTSRTAVRLGDVSYGVYLLQGLVLAMVFRPAPLREFALSSPWHHWSLALVAMVFLVMVATATHVLVERPGIAGGRWIAAALAARTLDKPGHDVRPGQQGAGRG